MIFAWPWALLALPLPWLLWWQLPARATADRLQHPLMQRWLGSHRDQEPARSGRSGFWLWLVWPLLIVALARPQTLGPPLIPAQPGRSLMLVVDLSMSMAEADMRWQNQTISRYQAVQAVVGDFVRQRRGDALGLIVFGDFAALQAPLTPDVDAVEGVLATLQPGMAGSRTAIGDALALAVQRLRQSQADNAVIILLSDGANTTGEVLPAQSAEAAEASGIRVHSIGFGAEPRLGVFTMSNSAVDEAALSAIADRTGGRYFRARSTEELAAVYQQLNALEPSPQRSLNSRQTHDWFWVPALVALVLLALGRWLSGRRSRA
ncbi:VWA domain-containing protein [Saccharospirillum sp. MSK14-1]|uniref:VWA domain-containing protein n=1 Tax=Saccharospirillum sp. MSK14-1 TaxID=1897632 RepID=UPI0011B299D7|nr:VWA domain-containing protein [Saccharospirillum sp. MSK14-1]